MNKKLKSVTRDSVKKLSGIIIKDDIFRKRLIVMFYNLKNLKFKKDVLNKDIFDYKKIVSDKKHKCNEIYRGNSFYGIGTILKQFANFDKPIKGCIEHGVYFGNYVNPQETYETNLPAVITFSQNRKNHIRKFSNKPVFCIGPYINYAESIYTEKEIEDIKKNLGKTLLVFPVHSVDRIEVKFNQEELIECIQNFKEKYKFDTVLVCLYWKDIELKKELKYIDNGYTIVTAGNRNDSLFLNRLRTLIDLSDYTISNSVGTHIGYCVSLGKPHYIINQYSHYSGDTEIDIKNEFCKLEMNIKEEEVKEVKSVFSEYNSNITSRQINVCNKFWGLDKIRSPEEIQLIFKFCESYYSKNKNIDLKLKCYKGVIQEAIE